MDTAGFIARVETLLPQALVGGAVLSDAASHLAMARGAKRARPMLVFHAAQVCDVLPGPALVDVATAIELMHSASLIHDDVVDEGEERRGLPTVNHRYGNTVAVLTGDLVLSRALGLLQPKLVHAAIAVVEEMTRAAHLEVIGRKGGMDLPMWREMAEGKSGALFGLCGKLVALLRDDEALAERFDRCGRHLGVAFQIADDLVDENDEDARMHNPSFPRLAGPVSAVGAIAYEIDKAKSALGEAQWHPAMQPVWRWAEGLK